MRRIATLVVAGTVCASLSACGSSAPLSRASLIAAALAQKSVHYVENDETDMCCSQGLTADVTADSGIARLESSDDGEKDMRLLNDTVYIREDASGLAYDFGLSPARAKRYAWRWISVPRADKPDTYTALWYLTLAAVVQNVPWNVSRVRVVNKLPTRFDKTTHNDGDTTATDGRFSRWNEPVHVEAPTSSTPIATVRG